MTPSGDATSRKSGLNRISVFPCCSAASAYHKASAASLPRQLPLMGARSTSLQQMIMGHLCRQGKCSLASRP